MLKGRALYGKSTKKLVKKLKPGDIAVISHQDLDRVAGFSLKETGVNAVVNTRQTISGKYPNKGPNILIKAGILIYDNCDEEIISSFSNGDILELKNGKVKKGNKIIGKGDILNREKINLLIKKAEENLNSVLEKFIDNTLEYANNEKKLILELDTPDFLQLIEGKKVLIVVRGIGYKRDLKLINSYIQNTNPVIIAVDGAADCCLDFGFKPDIIIGDMDSVSDKALKCGSQLVAHAYNNGRSPALKRLKKLGISPVIFSSPGTSEDIAMLLAYENKAELIVTVGTHTNMIDFLEKGREGMGSTILVRLKVGNKLVDLRGLSKLYQ